LIEKAIAAILVYLNDTKWIDCTIVINNNFKLQFTLDDDATFDYREDQEILEIRTARYPQKVHLLDVAAISYITFVEIEHP